MQTSRIKDYIFIGISNKIFFLLYNFVTLLLFVRSSCPKILNLLKENLFDFLYFFLSLISLKYKLSISTTSNKSVDTFCGTLYLLRLTLHLYYLLKNNKFQVYRVNGNIVEGWLHFMLKKTTFSVQCNRYVQQFNYIKI